MTLLESRRLPVCLMVACIAVASAPGDAGDQTSDTVDSIDRAGPRAPLVSGLGVVLTVVGAPLLVGGATLLADGLARDQPGRFERIDDMETSGGLMLLGGGAILVGAGIPTIVWGMQSDAPARPASATPVVGVGAGRGAGDVKATWTF